MSVVRWLLVVFLVLMSQVTWLPAIRIGGVAPDLLLGVVFLIALRRGPTWAVWTGFFLGLLLGVEDPAALGMESLAYTLAAIVVARGGRSLDRTNPLVLVVLLFLTALAAGSVRAVWMGRGDLGPISMLWLRNALPGALYTTLALPLLAWIASRILGWKDWHRGAA